MTLERRYERAREIFRQFKAGLEENCDLRSEVLTALELLLSERSTSFYENRFISGGAAEHIIAAAMRCVGLSDVRTVGFEETRVDLLVEEQGFSVKSSFTGSNSIALINVQGDSEEVEWTTPTILVLGVGLSRGIGYIDPELVPGDAISHGRDQITVNRTPVNVLFRGQPEYLLRCEVPVNPGIPEDPAQMPTAISSVVAQDILLRTETGPSLLSDDFIAEFFRGTASGTRKFPLLSQCMEENDDAG